MLFLFEQSGDYGDYVLVSKQLPATPQSTKSIRHHSYMLFSTLASIVVVVIDVNQYDVKELFCFLFLDSKFVPAPQSLDMNYLLCKLFPYTTELQSNK